MQTLTRRSLLRASAGLAATGILARPHIANAQAKTATMWLAQGFVKEEDEAYKKLVADYQKASGNTISYSIIPFAPLRQKMVSAITSGGVPDLMEPADFAFSPIQAWNDRLIDISDIVEPAKSHYLPAAVDQFYTYNSKTKRRAYYGVPWKAATVPFHIWGDLVEKAGYKLADIPKTWTKFLDFFKPMQKKLQAQGMNHTYSYGWEVSTIGVDPINTLFAFNIAYGGKNLVTPDGKLHSKDPHVRESLMRALSRLSSDFKGGYVPKGVVNWNDADDNNAFHSRLVVVDFDGTLSTELAMIHDKTAYDAMVTHGLPLDDHGHPMPAQVFAPGLVIAKGAKNVEVAKDFIKYSMQPNVLNEYLKGGLGRWVIPLPEVAKNDPWWLKSTDQHRAVYFHETLVGPTMPIYEAYSPAIAEVNAEHLFQVAWADITTGGMKPQDALAKAFKRAEDIFAKYPMAQA